MGLSLFSKSTDEGYEPKAGDPVPTNFKILQLEEYASNVVAIIQYPDATSYEGVKVLVFLDTSPYKLRHYVSIDPHFSDVGGRLTPFARFEPTEKGLQAARHMAKNIQSGGSRSPLFSARCSKDV